MEYKVINTKTGKVLSRQGFAYLARYDAEDFAAKMNAQDTVDLAIYADDQKIGSFVLIPRLVMKHP